VGDTKNSSRLCNPRAFRDLVHRCDTAVQLLAALTARSCLLSGGAAKCKSLASAKGSAAFTRAESVFRVQFQACTS
jgi:hypothetical protein